MSSGRSPNSSRAADSPSSAAQPDLGALLLRVGSTVIDNSALASPNPKAGAPSNIASPAANGASSPRTSTGLSVPELRTPSGVSQPNSRPTSINRYSRSEENVSNYVPSPSSTSLNSDNHRSSTLSVNDDSEADPEEDAEEACLWLQRSGFPQYAQFYRENIECDPAQVKADHDFLNDEQLQPVTKRVLILNAALLRRARKSPGSKARRSLAKVQSSEIESSDEESDEEDTPSIQVDAAPADEDFQPRPPRRRSRGSSRRGRKAEGAGATAQDMDGSTDTLSESLDDAGPLTPALSSNWTFRSDSKKWSRSFKEARRLSDSPLENITLAKIYAQKWTSFMRQKSTGGRPSTPSSSEKVIANLSCREMLVVQRLSVLSLTGMLDNRAGADSSFTKRWEKKVMRSLTKLLEPNRKIVYNAVGVFGVPLQTILERTGQPLPLSIYDALMYLGNHCAQVEGLFRKAGATARIRDLREKCDKGTETIDFTSFSPHDVADVVKQFFRDLPEPLLTSTLVEIFIEAEKTNTEQTRHQMMQLLIPLLPDENREALQLVLSMLVKIAANAQGSGDKKGNQMDARNLALVFAPNIFHVDRNPPKSGGKNTFTKADSRESALREAQAQEVASNCLQHMIEDTDALFRVSDGIFEQALDVTTGQVPPPGLLHLFDATHRPYFASLMQQQTTNLMNEASGKFKSFFFHTRTDAVRIAYKREEDEMLQTWCGQAIANTSPERALERLVHQRYLWDPEVEKEHLVEEISKEMDVFHYTRRGRGPIRPRDYILLRSWKNFGNGKCVLVCVSIRHPSVPEVPGVVRATVYQHSFYIEKNDAATSKITYISRVDLKGRTPNWYNRAYGVHDVMVLTDIRKVLDMQQLPGPETCV
ncbi:hypothetical protein CAOG_00594 [Capsaspora owczarzaki ATCC 30864]|uniref:Uncharacterized protein n=1 Tax=Capsaspora owczarzaki (strain ATCC 30864) TaxID=595528 RepID=A0A0D2WHE6_CAPO3|nr:hypothetical protein CAOG_00594 [Capsaspora owczarzaki ATCC 30864]KJE89035.1 hypothetical protein CAOG_000594 [Capsaspora owczarzaki ATCC 30864]|eukprot:XP_004365465.1 hypothetical protein CAOG_00594 [Capsaspora owczarzaki ATCC 30864]